MNDPLYNHFVFGPEKGRGGNIGKTDEKLIADLISIHNAENWLGMDGDSDLSMFNKDGESDTIEDIAVKLLDSDPGKKEGELRLNWGFRQLSFAGTVSNCLKKLDCLLRPADCAIRASNPSLNVIANFIALFLSFSFLIELRKEWCNK